MGSQWTIWLWIGELVYTRSLNPGDRPHQRLLAKGALVIPGAIPAKPHSNQMAFLWEDWSEKVCN